MSLLGDDPILTLPHHVDMPSPASATHSPALSWKRWGQWCAHLFVEDEQACTSRHGHYRGVHKPEAGWAPTVLVGDDLTPHGIPYGRVCSFCLRQWHRRRVTN